MKTTLDFVKGAAATQDFVPVLRSFLIRNGRITAYNGTLALSAPIPLDLTIAPNAAQFFRAISACDEAVALTVADNGNLVVSSGAFKAVVSCEQVLDFPFLDVGREAKPLAFSLREVCKKLRPFIGKDLTRAWMHGIFFTGRSAVATNGIVLAEQWLGVPVPAQFTLPAWAVDEILRIKEEPSAIAVAEKHVLITYTDGRWVRSNLLEERFVDVRGRLDELQAQTKLAALPDSFFESVKKLSAMTNEHDSVYLLGDTIATTHTPNKEGACIRIPGLNATGIYAAKRLLLLDGLATKIDFSQVERPAFFIGEKIRGGICGQRT